MVYKCNRKVQSVYLPAEGTHTWFKPRYIFLTSDKHPKEWYRCFEKEEKWSQFNRRITRYTFSLDVKREPGRMPEIEDLTKEAEEKKQENQPDFRTRMANQYFQDMQSVNL